MLGPCATAGLLALLSAAAVSSALEFDLGQHQTTRCVSEELNESVLCLGEFSAMDTSTQQPVPLKVEVRGQPRGWPRASGGGAGSRAHRVLPQVTDPHGATLHHKEQQTAGTFAFTSKLAGDYKACFTARDIHTAQNTRVRLDWKVGVAAKDWSAIAKKENLDAMATELRKLEDAVRDIHSQMLHLRQREEDMRNLNGKRGGIGRFGSLLQRIS